MKRRFNVVDIVLVALVVLGGIGALALRNHSTGEDARRETTPIQYTVEIANVLPDAVNQMHPGDEVFRSTDGEYLGKIVEAHAVPHPIYEFVVGLGRIVRYESRENVDIYLTIENDGYITDRQIMMGKISPRLCGDMYVKGKGFSRVGYVYAIDTMGAEIPENTDVGTGDLELTYVLRLSEMRPALLDSVKVGERLYEQETGALLGMVLDVWTEPYGETRADADGKAVFVEREGYYNLFIRLKGRAVEREDGYYLDGATELRVGSNVTASSQFLSRLGSYYQLESIEDAA